MRLKNTITNSIVNIITIMLGFLPSFIVRKSFLNSLGEELLGLSSVYGNIIGVLSIVELGIGSAIIFSLYRPFAEDNKEKIKGYLEYYGIFYKIVGFIILILGLLTTIILPIFIKDEINMLDARFYFILFLINTFITYMFSHKLCILNVAQEGYKISIGTSISKIIIATIQLISLKIYPSFYLYLVIQILINLIYYAVMNSYISRRYLWLKDTKGFINKEERKQLSRNVKALFIHKIGGMIVFGVDNLVISSFINLKIVGIYNSYNMIIGAFQTVISSALSGVTASIGNLLTEDDPDKAYEVHKRLFFISFWIVSFTTISLSNTIKQFTILWLGDNQILDTFTVTILLINLYFILMRGSVERFKEGAGIYHEDRFAPIFESLINLITSIILVNIIGLPGVFLGTLISNLSVVFWVKPKIVYKYVFNRNISEYFKMYLKYLIIGLLPLIITHILTINLRNNIDIISFLLNCVVNIVVINVIYVIVLKNSEEFKYFNNIISNLLKKKINNIKEIRLEKN
ncbi:MAG: oligosaccharide flippase family protein [Romboutsia timonensis]|uniref:lipopolysaccharide biosynthesis protein n=1 Tax=Romboutsia timonensis TaxID=1776391 RepID=UPI002A74969E|nr:oligosaccharide flippase family protein [Romboutsia timonensis]MDY3002431.1 oligosaccharide flippase family protein [Romboutsia timonensis]